MVKDVSKNRNIRTPPAVFQHPCGGESEEMCNCLEALLQWVGVGTRCALERSARTLEGCLRQAGTLKPSILHITSSRLTNGQKPSLEVSTQSPTGPPRTLRACEERVVGASEVACFKTLPKSLKKHQCAVDNVKTLSCLVTGRRKNSLQLSRYP